MSGNVDDGDDDVGMKPLWQVPILGTVNLIQNSQDNDLKKKVAGLLKKSHLLLGQVLGSSSFSSTSPTCIKVFVQSFVRILPSFIPESFRE